MVWGGSRKTLIFDDLDGASPLRIHDHRLAPDVQEVPGGEGGGWERSHPGVRAASWSPRVEGGEALQAMVRHFAECALGDKEPLSDGWLGLRVVQVLEAATRSLRADGARVAVATNEGIIVDGDPGSRRVGEHFTLAQDHLMLRSQG